MNPTHNRSQHHNGSFNADTHSQSKQSKKGWHEVKSEEDWHVVTRKVRVKQSASGSNRRPAQNPARSYGSGQSAQSQQSQYTGKAKERVEQSSSGRNRRPAQNPAISYGSGQSAQSQQSQYTGKAKERVEQSSSGRNRRIPQNPTSYQDRFHRSRILNSSKSREDNGNNEYSEKRHRGFQALKSDPHEAIEIFLELMKTNPMDSKPHIGLAQAYYKIGDEELQAQHNRAAFNLGDMKAGEIFSLFLRNTGKHEEAIPVLEEVLEHSKKEKDLEYQEKILMSLFYCYNDAKPKDAEKVLQAGMKVLDIQKQQSKDLSKNEWLLNSLTDAIEILPETKRAQRLEALIDLYPSIGCFSMEYLHKTLIPHKNFQKALEVVNRSRTEINRSQGKRDLDGFCSYLGLEKARAYILNKTKQAEEAEKAYTYIHQQLNTHDSFKWLVMAIYHNDNDKDKDKERALKLARDYHDKINIENRKGPGEMTGILLLDKLMLRVLLNPRERLEFAFRFCAKYLNGSFDDRFEKAEILRCVIAALLYVYWYLPKEDETSVTTLSMLKYLSIQARELDPDNPNILRQRAHILRHDGQCAEARDCWIKADCIDPEHDNNRKKNKDLNLREKMSLKSNPQDFPAEYEKLKAETLKPDQTFRSLVEKFKEEVIKEEVTKKEVTKKEVTGNRWHKHKTDYTYSTSKSWI